MRLAALAVLSGLASLGGRAQAPQSPPAEGTVCGQVVDRDGAVYEGARISLTPDGGRAWRTAQSDSSGRFSFEHVPAGGFHLTIAAPGFAAQTVTGMLRAGERLETAPVVLPLTIATSEVRVTASEHEIAQQELIEEEQQRVLGLFPNFDVIYAPGAPPLSPRQKFQLATRESVDWMTLLGTGFSAGIEQASNAFKGYGQGTAGYARRFGAAYGDNVIGTMLGSAILPTLLKQDPRYFYKGTGTKRERVWYAIKMSVICKGDNGRWQPNYSNMLADVGSAEISNQYYPAGDRNKLSVIFTNIAIGKASDIGQNIFQEFFARRFTPKAPAYAAKP